eukprot:1154655-Rhodomonas_salina.1
MPCSVPDTAPTVDEYIGGSPFVPCWFASDVRATRTTNWSDPDIPCVFAFPYSSRAWMVNADFVGEIDDAVSPVPRIVDVVPHSAAGLTVSENGDPF